jgi:methionine-rich copper-binding protein CopC
MKPIALAILFTAVVAQSAAAQDPTPSASLLGVWAVDTSRLPMAPAARPKSVRITFSDAGPDQLRTRVEVVDPAGNRLEADGVTPLDGAPTEVKVNFEADVSATTMPRPGVLIMQLGKNRAPASTRIFTVAPDGISMIETVAYFSPSGQPVLRKNYFSRLL